MTHTPGPWTFNARDDDTVIVDNNDTEIAAVPWDRRQPIAKHRANARLIAAAPTMLAALRAINARIDGVWDDPCLVSFGPMSPDALADIRLIANAGLVTGIAHA
jgi:hypothetical protein